MYQSFTNTIFRITKKVKSLHTRTLSNVLGISEKSVYRVLRGQRLLTADEWIRYCQFIELAPSVTLSRSPYIELSKNSKVNFREDCDYGDFKIPQRYTVNKGSTVRLLLPFIKLSQKKIGRCYTEEFFKQRGIDPDFQYIIDYPINTLLTHEFIEGLIEKKVITRESFNNDLLLNEFIKNEIHGKSLNKYQKSKSNIDVLLKFVSRANKNYDCNYIYSIVDSTDNFITVEMYESGLMKEFSIKADMKKFSYEYRKNILFKMQTFEGHRPGKFKVLEDGENKCKMIFHRSLDV